MPEHGRPDLTDPADPTDGASRELAATVGEHHADGGWVVLDDGTRQAFGAAVVAPQVRLLHPGQRVHLRVVGGVVQALTLVSLPLPGRRRLTDGDRPSGDPDHTST